MALNLGELYVQLGARTSGLRRAEGHAQRFARNTERSFNRSSRAANALNRAIAAVISVEAARRIVMMADAFNILQQRIKTATRLTEDYNIVYNNLYRISNDTGTLFETNVKLFQRLARAAPELGATNNEMTQLTETVGQLGVMSGASAQALKFGLLQFSQGMSSVIFRAEEMNSLLENIPELAVRIGRGLGMNVGELRRKVIDGKLLSRDVYKSIIGQVKEIDQEFQNIPMTIERSWSILKNSFSVFLEQWDELSGMTGWIAGVMKDIGIWFRQDHSQGLGVVVEMFARIRDSFQLWKESLSDTGVLDSLIWQLKVVGQALKFAFDIMIEWPIYYKFLAITIIESTKMFTVAVIHGWEVISLNAQIVFENLKAGWMAMSHFMGENFLSFVNSFKGMWAQMLQFVAKGMSLVPGLKDEAAQLDSYAQAIINSALVGETALAKANEEDKKRRAEKIKGLRAQLRESTGTAQLEIALSVENIKAARSEGAERLRLLNLKREERVEAVRMTKIQADQLEVANAAINNRAQTENLKRAKARQLEIAEESLALKIKGLEKNLNKELKALDKSSSTALEIENKRYEEGLKTLNTAFLLKTITGEKHNSLMEKLERSHQENLAKIAEQNKPKENSEWEQRLKKAIDALRALEKLAMTATELEHQNYQQQLFDLDQAQLLKITSVFEYHRLREILEEQHLRRLRDIQEEHDDKHSKQAAYAALVGFKMWRGYDEATLAERGDAFRKQLDSAAQHNKEAFELQKAFALATALIDAPASILSAYKFGSALAGPIGGAAAAALSAGAVAVQVAAIQASRFSGNKATGGDVFGGGMYRVNENGPEMLSSGGKEYLMMGKQGGNITPNNKLSGGARGNVIVNVFPQAGETARVEQSENGDTTQIDVIMEAVDERVASGINRGNSQTAEAIQRVYGANRANGAG